jgi:predicted membrane metal-binding protein
MPSIISPTELDQLVALIAAQPDGLGIDAIAKLQGNRLTRRTLQRRLALLVKLGRIQMLGEARAVRYMCAAQANRGSAAIQTPLPTLQATGEVYVPTSPEGEEIKALVRQPRAMRAPVGYRLAFLEQYHPNHTAYLPSGLRDQLHTMGRARTEQTPAGTFARDILNESLAD